MLLMNSMNEKHSTALVSGENVFLCAVFPAWKYPPCIRQCFTASGSNHRKATHKCRKMSQNYNLMFLCSNFLWAVSLAVSDYSLFCSITLCTCTIMSMNAPLCLNKKSKPQYLKQFNNLEAHITKTAANTWQVTTVCPRDWYIKRFKWFVN